MMAARSVPRGERSREAQRADDGRLVERLVGGDKSAWGDLVDGYGPVIYGAIGKTLRRYGRDSADASDIAQDVFLRLCNDGYRLLRQYDPARAALSTWLTVVATSGAIDFLRRQKAATSPLDDLPEHVAAVEPKMPDPVRIPDGLLSPRQSLVLQLLYDREMEVAEIAAMLAVDAQTVRSTHHKALVKLRAYFAPED
jgi:DNA-directed RNA polymerase specialized sigma24 family protein